MRVTLFIDTYRVGGAERYLVDLANGLAEREVDVTAITTGSPAVAYLRERLDESVDLRVLSPRRVFAHSFAANVVHAVDPFVEIRAAVRATRPDVLHVNNGGYPGSHLARAAVFSTSAPRVMTVNSGAQPRSGARGHVYWLLDPVMWSRLGCVIAPSKAAAASLLELRGVPRRKLHVVHYGIGDVTAEPDEVRRLRDELTPNGTLLVTMVTAPDPSPDAVYKGHHVLLEAIAKARSSVAAVLVGHEPGPAFEQRARELGVADRIAVHGGFRNSAPYIHAGDVLAVPSTRYEALPLVILEALGAGTPVLASRLAGIPEAVLDGISGYTFAPGDDDALAGILDRLAADRRELSRLREGARQVFEERFERSAMIDRTLEVYEAAGVRQGAEDAPTQHACQGG